jgi:hypothetical protein
VFKTPAVRKEKDGHSKLERWQELFVCKKKNSGSFVNVEIVTNRLPPPFLICVITTTLGSYWSSSVVSRTFLCLCCISLCYILYVNMVGLRISWKARFSVFCRPTYLVRGEISHSLHLPRKRRDVQIVTYSFCLSFCSQRTHSLSIIKTSYINVCSSLCKYCSVRSQPKSEFVGKFSLK